MNLLKSMIICQTIFRPDQKSEIFTAKCKAGKACNPANRRLPNDDLRMMKVRCFVDCEKGITHGFIYQVRIAAGNQCI